MRISLQNKLILLFTFVLSVSFVVVYGNMKNRITEDLARSSEKELAVKADLARTAVEEIPGEFLSVSRLSALAKKINNDLGMRVTILDMNGKVLADSSIDDGKLKGIENHSERPEIKEAAAKGAGMSRRQSATLGGDMLYAAESFKVGAVNGIIRISIPEPDAAASLEGLKKMMTRSFAMMLIVSVFLSIFAAGVVSRPVKDMAEFASAVSKGDFSKRAVVRNNDEIKDLSDELNRMAGNIKNKIDEMSETGARFEAVFSNITEGVMIIDDRGRISLVNGALLSLFGISGDVVNLKPVEAVKNLDIQDIANKALLGQDGPMSREVYLESPEEKFLFIHAAPIIKSGIAQGAVLVFSDITKIRKMESAKKDFAPSAPHEVKTQVIMPDAGALKLDIKPCDLKNIVKNVITGLKKAIDEKQLQVHFDINGKTQRINADEAKISQAVYNLIMNAVKNSKPKGEIKIRSRLLNGKIEVMIADSGSGMPVQELTRVFDRPHKLIHAGLRDADEVGAGLSLVKNIVDAHGGSVRAESAENKGSTFYFTVYPA